METDAEIPWSATQDGHDDLKNLILEIKHKNDRMLKLLIVLLIVVIAIQIVTLILFFVP